MCKALHTIKSSNSKAYWHKRSTQNSCNAVRSYLHRWFIKLIKCESKIRWCIESLSDMKCSAGYKLNPHSGTCMRFVRTRRKWFDAEWLWEERRVSGDIWHSGVSFLVQKPAAYSRYDIQVFLCNSFKKTVLMYTTQSIVVTTLPVRRDISCYLIDGLLAWVI